MREERSAFRTPGFESGGILGGCQALQRFARTSDHRYFAGPGAANDQRVGIDLNERLRRQHLRVPLHRIALGQSGTDDDQDVGFVRSDRIDRPVRATVTKHAERERVALGDQTFPRQRGRNRNVEAFDKRAKRVDPIRMQHAGAGKHDDLLIVRGVQQTDGALERRLVHEPGAAQRFGDQLPARIDLGFLHVDRHREVDRQTARKSICDRMPEVMGNDSARGERKRQSGDSAQRVDVVDRGTGGILKAAHAFPGTRDLPADRKDWAAVGSRGGERRCHVKDSRPADSEAHAETTRGPRVAVGHVGRSALKRGDDRPQALGPGQRWHEVVVQAAEINETMIDALIAQRGEYVIGYSH
jgi:hypothetical protein